MVEHIWSVLCTESIVDRDTNNLSLISTLEQWNLPPGVEFPTVIGNPFVLVTMWTRSDIEVPDQGRARIIISSPSGQRRELPDFEIDLTHYRRVRNRHGFQGFQVTGPGIYVFEMELLDDGSGGEPRIVASVPIEVRITDPEAPE